uniref:Uncharacterized protein n=1 Tax=Molossus molossus TaxID=27622 RepID=A0A7J8JXW3_MOLMO|nr:hypothetical protein HJG59_008131 [Molossus molossus]
MVANSPSTQPLGQPHDPAWEVTHCHFHHVRGLCFPNLPRCPGGWRDHPPENRCQKPPRPPATSQAGLFRPVHGAQGAPACGCVEVRTDCSLHCSGQTQQAHGATLGSISTERQCLRVWGKSRIRRKHAEGLTVWVAGLTCPQCTSNVPPCGKQAGRPRDSSAESPHRVTPEEWKTDSKHTWKLKPVCRSIGDGEHTGLATQQRSHHTEGWC